MKYLAILLFLFSSIAIFADEVELLRDPSSVKGLSYLNGTIRDNLKTQCNDQYRSKGITKPQWAITEVCEWGCLCNNPENPTVNSASIEYSSQSKSIVIDKQNHEVTFTIDSSQEWNRGCELNADVNGISPVYKNENTPWNWHHLFLNQGLGKVSLDKYESLIVSGEFKIEETRRTSFVNCPNWHPDHLLFKMGLKIVPKVDTSNLPKIFLVLRLWSTEDGTSYAKWDVGPFITGDHRGELVYMPPLGPSLHHIPLDPQRFDYQKVAIDVKRVAREALTAYLQTAGKKLKEEDYAVSLISYSTEIWGGYALKMKIRNFSLKGYNNDLESKGWYRYYNAKLQNHYYSKNYFPNGFPGYEFEGQVAHTPVKEVKGMVPLYEYYNKSLVDHYYSTNAWPFGAGGKIPCGFPRNKSCGDWGYGGVTAFVWADPGPQRIPIYEFWNGKDHFYSHIKGEGLALGYSCAPNCETPRFYMNE
ncbi:MAG: hypothetical protein KDD40_09875 [Bdellovibrionales bacterium]|nr:hypothetical protein [Bdellovibrionales bacterium]